MPVDGADIRDGSRSPRGLVSSSREMPGRWEGGIDLRFDGCSEPEIVDRCVTDDGALYGAEVVRVDPFLVRSSANCTPLSNLDVEATASNRLSRTVEWSVGRALATGLGITEGPSLADCTPFSTTLTERPAVFACFEQAASDASFGGQVWIHTSIAGASILNSLDLIGADSAGRLTTAAGSLVVVSPGYPADCASGTATIWATGPVYLGLTEVETLAAAVDRQNNQEVWAQRYASVAFDPCLNICLDFPLEAA